MKLEEVSRIVIHEVLDVQKGEEVLIITNPGEVLGISLSLFNAAKEFHTKPTIIIQEPKTSLEFAERSVIEAIKSEPDIVISITEKKIGKRCIWIEYRICRKRQPEVYPYF